MLRHALAATCATVALMSACSRYGQADPDMQPSAGVGYTVQTTGAAIGVDAPYATDGRGSTIDFDVIAAKLAEEICAREVRCQKIRGSFEGCVRAGYGRAKRELSAGTCSPAAARARAEECLASVGIEPCELDLLSRPTLCGSNVACRP